MSENKWWCLFCLTILYIYFAILWLDSTHTAFFSVKICWVKTFLYFNILLCLSLHTPTHTQLVMHISLSLSLFIYWVLTWLVRFVQLILFMLLDVLKLLFFHKNNTIHLLGAHFYKETKTKNVFCCFIWMSQFLIYKMVWFYSFFIELFFKYLYRRKILLQLYKRNIKIFLGANLVFI